ncbi:MAG: putative transcriptional regulator [Rhodospirillaceae bacterium]|nr:putative transcriptional regulator [Rhodospirillaceae bacterium]
MWPTRILLACVVLLAPMLVRAAPEPAVVTVGGASKGQLLIAAPRIDDPRFHHTVILMVQHDQGGALGIIINRPVEEHSLANLMAMIGAKDDGVHGKVLVFAGGPVEPWIGFILHSPEYERTGTVHIDEDLAMTSNPEILRDIGHDKGPRKRLVAFGYTGWGPGQLELEMARHDWYTAPADPNLVFDDDRKKLWQDAMAHRSSDL